MWSESIAILNPYEAVTAAIIAEAAEKQLRKNQRRKAIIDKLNRLFSGTKLSK